MKIWIVSVGEPLPTDGANVRLRRMGNLAALIAEDADNQVDWFSVSFDHYKKKQRVQKDTVIALKENYRMHLAYVNGYKRNVSVARIVHHALGGKKIFREMCRQTELPDVILASMEPLEMSSAAVRFGKKFDVPVIVDVRDLWPEIYYEVIPSQLHFLLNLYVGYCKGTLRKTMSRADSIVGLSPDFLNYGLKYAGRERTELDAVIPIAYPDYDYESYRGRYDILERFGICKDDFLAVFFGNFGNQFDFEPIVEAAGLLKDHPHVKFVLCGTGIQMDDVKARCPDNVIFTGWIEKEEIMTLSANGAVGIAPYIDSMNYRKNTPNKFGEYLCASLPPLVSVDGMMQQMLSEFECGTKYDNGQQLASIVLSYYENEEKLRTESARARDLYEKRFSGNVVNKEFEDQIEKLVRSGK